jgi:dipeptidyl-peptidase-4
LVGPGVVRQMHKRLGEIEVADLGASVAWLMRQPWCDAKRIGLWGWSYGGTLTCLAMTRLDCFRAGVAVAPVTRWEDYDTIYTERYMLRPQDNAEGYRAGAPVTHAAQLAGRLLLVHGLADDNVHFQNAVHFTDALVAAGRPFEQLVYGGRDHGIRDREARIHLFTAMRDFFERELR